MKSLMNGYVS